MNSWLTFLNLTSFWLNQIAILFRGCISDKFESLNSLKLGFPTFVVFVRVLLKANLSLNQTLLILLHILDDSVDSGNFYVRSSH